MPTQLGLCCSNQDSLFALFFCVCNKMGDTACLMHSSSYVSVVIPNESIQVLQGNANALGQSISFGKFMTDETLSWDKWSTFPHKKYVEEAERYAQPGSVARKKAFFEAHYKKIAAQKAAALLEQQNAAKTESEPVDVASHTTTTTTDNNNDYETDVDAKTELVKIQDSKQDDVTSVNELNNSINLLTENNFTRSTKKSRLDSSPNKKRSSSKSLLALMNLVPINEPDRDPSSATKKSESSPKDSSTPFKNPVAASIESVSSYTETNSDQPENRRIKTLTDSSAAPGRKNGPKWRMLSAICSKSLRTEGERAAKRKQVKAGNGYRKLSCSFCFKAQPMVDPCTDGATPRNQIKKAPAIQPRSIALERSNSNKTHDSTLVPPPPPPPTRSVNNSPSKNLSKK